MSSASALSFQLLRDAISESMPADFWSREFGSLRNRQRVLARITAIETETQGFITLKLKANQNFQGFQPGQHVNVTAEVDGRRITRSYSLTGIPSSDRCLSLTIQQIPGGLVSTHLFTRAVVGDVVELSQAFGDMTISPHPTRPILLLAAGSGITPLMSLTRSLASQGFPSPLTLIYWARHRSEFCFASELRALAKDHANFRVKFAVTGDAATRLDELRGRISQTQITANSSDLVTSDVYCCGPSGFVEAARSICERSAQSFQAESFTPPSLLQNSEAEARTVKILLARSNRVVEVQSGKPLLTELEAQGLRPASGCRMGICNSCACGKSDGISSNLKHGGQNDAPDSNLRICISSAQSDLTLDL